MSNEQIEAAIKGISERLKGLRASNLERPFLDKDCIDLREALEEHCKDLRKALGEPRSTA